MGCAINGRGKLGRSKLPGKKFFKGRGWRKKREKYLPPPSSSFEKNVLYTLGRGELQTRG